MKPRLGELACASWSSGWCGLCTLGCMATWMPASTSFASSTPRRAIISRFTAGGRTGWPEGMSRCARGQEQTRLKLGGGEGGGGRRSPPLERRRGSSAARLLTRGEPAGMVARHGRPFGAVQWHLLPLGALRAAAQGPTSGLQHVERVGRARAGDRLARTHARALREEEAVRQQALAARSLGARAGACARRKSVAGLPARVNVRAWELGTAACARALCEETPTAAVGHPESLTWAEDAQPARPVVLPRSENTEKVRGKLGRKTKDRGEYCIS